MPRRKISHAEFERQLAGHVDPIGQLPSGFPSTHSRIPQNPSQFVVDQVAKLEDDELEEDPDEDEKAAREEIRARFLSVARLF